MCLMLVADGKAKKWEKIMAWNLYWIVMDFYKRYIGKERKHLGLREDRGYLTLYGTCERHMVTIPYPGL